MPKRDGSPTKGEARLAKQGIDVAREGVKKWSRNRDEAEFKQWLRKWWLGWIDTYEPTMGTGVGFPDLQILVDYFLQPIELKAGEIRDGRVFPREVRPAQVVWHRKFFRAGGSSFLLIGVKSGSGRDIKWSALAVSGERAKYWRKGYAIGSEAYLINTGSDRSFADRLVFFTRDFRKGHFR